MRKPRAFLSWETHKWWNSGCHSGLLDLVKKVPVLSLAVKTEDHLQVYSRYLLIMWVQQACAHTGCQLALDNGDAGPWKSVTCARAVRRCMGAGEASTSEFLTFSCFLSVTSLGAWDTVWCSKWGLRSQHRLVWRRPLPFLRLVFSTLHGWFLSLRFVRKVFPSNTACH